MAICLRMRYGIHTFALLVDPLAPFSTVTTELFFALRDRSEQGLQASAADAPEPLPPVGKNVQVSYGVLKDQHDVSKGWKDLDIQGDETPVSKGLKNNALVAFVIWDPEELDEAPDFVAQWPRLEEDEEEADIDEDMADGEQRPVQGNGKGKAEAVYEDDELDL